MASKCCNSLALRWQSDRGIYHLLTLYIVSEGDLKTAKTQLKWIGTPSLGQGRSSGGNAASEIFEAGGSQRKRSLLETLVREICQNSLDQRKDKKVKIFFDLMSNSLAELNSWYSLTAWEKASVPSDFLFGLTDVVIDKDKDKVHS